MTFQNHEALNIDFLIVGVHAILHMAAPTISPEITKASTQIIGPTVTSTMSLIESALTHIGLDSKYSSTRLPLLLASRLALKHRTCIMMTAGMLSTPSLWLEKGITYQSSLRIPLQRSRLRSTFSPFMNRRFVQF